MARRSKVNKDFNTDFSSVILMIPKSLHDEALAVARQKDEDIGNILMVEVMNCLQRYLKDNKPIKALNDPEDEELFQYSLFNSTDEESILTKAILPSSKDIGASRLLIDEDPANKVTYGQFWNVYEKKLAPFMGDKESSNKTKQWMGGLVKKYGTTNVMNAMMRLDNLAMMPANPVAWIAKVLTTMSSEDSFKRNHGGARGTSRSNSSGGMVNI